MQDKDQKTIRQMCDTFDVTARTLRFYETKELLTPLREGQKRLYTNRECARLKLILRGKRFGLDLEKIRQILNLYDIGDKGHTQLAASLDVGRERMIELTEQRDELTLALKELGDLINWGERQIHTAEADSTTAAFFFLMIRRPPRSTPPQSKTSNSSCMTSWTSATVTFRAMKTWKPISRQLFWKKPAKWQAMFLPR